MFDPKNALRSAQESTVRNRDVQDTFHPQSPSPSLSALRFPVNSVTVPSVDLTINEVRDLTASNNRERILPTAPIYQGNNNGCGTAALSVALGILGISQSKDALDDRLRAVNIGVTAQSLRDGARSFGVPANLYNHASFADIKGHIDNGRGVIGLIDNTPEKRRDSALHYVVINGYRDSNGERYLTLTDSGIKGAQGNGTVYEIRYEDYVSRAKDIRSLGVNVGYDNLILVMGREGERLPRERFSGQVQSVDTALSGASRIVDSFGQFREGRIGRGIFGLMEGGSDLVRGGVYLGLDLSGGLVSLPFRGVSKAAEFLGEQARSVFGDHTLAGKLLGGGFDLVGKGADFISNEVIGGVVDFAKDIGDAIAGGVKSAVSYVKDTGKKIGNWFKKVF